MTTLASEKPVWAGRYRIVRLLGEGERKQVYLARDLNMEREVALSLIEPEEPVPGQPSVTQWETFVMSKLGDHPRVITIHDVGEVEGHAYIVSQYMRGGDLRGLTKSYSGEGRKLPLALAVRLATETCEGLAHAHRHGIIHRDVQPGNVWMDEPEGSAHLGDFDLAISKSEDAPAPLTDQIVTTRAYMPPEQALGQPFDERSDLYSLGATLFELLAGRPPFEGTEQEVIDHHLNQQVESPRQIRPETPPPLDALVLRLLAKSKDDRPEDAESVVEALQSTQATLAAEEFDLGDLLTTGENRHVEFKSSLRYDYSSNTRNRVLEWVIAKTVAGLMNSEGGTLLIGVADDGRVLGIEQDYETLKTHPNRDGWELALAESFIKYLGPDAASCPSTTFSRRPEGTVAVVRCRPRSKPTWVHTRDGERQFFTRVGNSTRPLPEPFAEPYIAETWPR